MHVHNYVQIDPYGRLVLLIEEAEIDLKLVRR